MLNFVIMSLATKNTATSKYEYCGTAQRETIVKPVQPAESYLIVFEEKLHLKIRKFKFACGRCITRCL